MNTARRECKQESDTDATQKDFSENRDIYQQFSDGDIPCKHIYQEIFETENLNPYTNEGCEKLQWAIHQVKAASGYLESKTSAKKNLKQLAGIRDASGLAKWLSSFLLSIQACEKTSSALRTGKYDTKTLRTNTGNAIACLITARKAFCDRATALNPQVVTETLSDGQQREIYALGKSAPEWMQRLSQDTLEYYAHSAA